MDDRRPSKHSRTHGGAKNTNQSQATLDSSILACARLVLPFLEPRELASVGSTCKALNTIAKAITSLRSSDASRGFEKHPIPFINDVDDQAYSYFLYTPSQLHVSNAIRRQAWGLLTTESCGFRGGDGLGLDRIGEEVVGFGSGCDCGEKCGEECPCGLGFDGVDGLMGECGKGCGCGEECGRRVSQGGVSVRLRIVKDGRKGWGLRAGEFIQSGRLVCEYAGELLTTNEARRRQNMYDQRSKNDSSSALLVVREHLPSGKACLRINIDATRIGNVGRFINHSCDGGNLSTVIIRSSGNLLPQLCFFAAIDIQEGDELAFSYGSTRLRSNGLQCFCDSSSCCGVLPSEVT